MRIRQIYKFFILYSISFLLFITCQDRPHSNPFDPGFQSSEDVVIPKTTKVIDNQDWDDHLVSISSDSTTFTFDADLKKQYSLENNDVLISSKGEGLLRKITRINEQNSQIIVTTKQAAITEAVRDGEQQFELNLSDLQIEKVINYRSGVVLKTDRIYKKEDVQFEFDIDTDLCEGLELDGTFTIVPKIIGDFEISGWKIKKLEFGAKIEENLDMDLIATVASLTWHPTEDIKLTGITFHPITIWIGHVPVIITPVFEILAGANVDFTTKIRTGVTQNLEYETGVRYNNGTWEPFSELSKSFEYDEPELETTLTAKAYIKPKLIFKIYGVVSPKFYAELYSLLKADIADDPWWELYAGLKLGVGIHVGIWGTTLADWEEPIIAPPPFLLAVADQGLNTRPTADFTIEPKAGEVNTVFEFDASESSDNEDPLSDLQVRWDWQNDGTWDTNYSYDKTESYQYIAEGTYTVKLEVIDSGGLNDFTTKTVYVTSSNVSPTAEITSPENGDSFTEDESITFSGTGTDPEDGTLSGSSLVWTSDKDGQIGTGTSFNTSSLSVNTHVITLTVTDSQGATDSESITIYVTSSTNESPTADITSPSNGASFTEGESITFSGTGTDPEDGTLSGSSLVWTSDKDGQIGTGTSFTKSNLSLNTHTITLTVTDSDGNSDSESITILITVANTPPTASFTVSPESGDTDTNFQLDASGSSDNEDPLSDLQVRWDWEDDGIWDTAYSTDKTKTHQYISEGTYIVRLEVKDTGGLEDETTHQIKIQNVSITSFEITNPKLGSVVYAGQNNFKITWIPGNLNGEVTIDLFTNNDNFVKTIISNTNNNGVYYWDVDSSLPDGMYVIKITSLVDNSISGISEEFLLTIDISATLTQFVTCENVSGTTPQNIKSNFSQSDPYICSFVRFDNFNGQATIQLKWYYPNGDLFIEFPTQTATSWVYSWYGISTSKDCYGPQLNTNQGTYRVEVTFNNVLAAVIYFKYSSSLNNYKLINNKINNNPIIGIDN